MKVGDSEYRHAFNLICISVVFFFPFHCINFLLLFSPCMLHMTSENAFIWDLEELLGEGQYTGLMRHVVQCVPGTVIASCFSRISHAQWIYQSYLGQPESVDLLIVQLVF